MKRGPMWAVECDHVDGVAMTIIFFRSEADLDEFLRDVTPEQREDMDISVYYPVEEVA